MASKKRKKGNIILYVLKNILGTSLYLLMVLLITWFIVSFIGQKAAVNGNSMEPMLSNGDAIILDKITYRIHDPKRFDIIAFPYQYGNHKNYIKRIIGLPGETVMIDENGIIYINGEILSESYGREVIQSPGIAKNSITLGKDEYFVLGDNRNDSQDSRDPSVGPVKRDIIIGRAWLRLWPFHSFGVLKHQI